MPDGKKSKTYVPPLSLREQNVLTAIEAHFEDPKARRGPSIEELAEAANTNISTVALCIRSLEVRGLISRVPKKWRSIRLVN